MTTSTNDRAGQAFGIDIGGSGMKAAVVDLSTGELLSDRFRIATPQPATPEAMAEVVVELVRHHGWDGGVGCAFPAVVRNGVVESAANIDTSWIDVDADKLFTDALGSGVRMINDADAAGLAEVRFGAAAGRTGVVMMLTFGTGIGSGLFIDGVLVPNTELGHLELDGHDAESRAAASARKRHDWSWSHWSKKVEHYLRHVEALFSPDLFVVGGGVSKHPHKWLDHISIDTEIQVASMANNAGIVGAALVAP
ncbi:polyphosphate--glucose phosphotransferase [Ilumatobacter sp.]|uniref:polyphosphate--glucose phosphotransferase n=1 Tax=Ilumatobacter sp. TaxID=1967498 RepID=UPI003C51E3FE